LEQFISVFKNAVNMDDGDIVSDTELDGLEGWDSLGKFMLLSSIYSDYGVTIDVKALNAALTVGDIWRLVEGA
jgi:acyl carrier protein